jgi:hypothetical protein
MFAALPINGETWLICGGRDFTDKVMFQEAMSEIITRFGVPLKVVHGGYRGADTLADDWARSLAIEAVPVKAEWTKYGPGAGPVRNQKMLDDHRPNKVIAFPGHDGTADMVRRAHAQRDAGRINLDVIEIAARVTSA